MPRDLFNVLQDDEIRGQMIDLDLDKAKMRKKENDMRMKMREKYNDANVSDVDKDHIYENYPGDTLLDLGDGSSMEFFRAAQGNSDDYDNPGDPSVWRPFVDKYIATNNRQALQQIYNHKNTTDEVADYIYENYPGDTLLDLGDGTSMEFFRAAQGSSGDYDNPNDPSTYKPFVDKYIGANNRQALQQIYGHKNTTGEVGDYIYENYPGDRSLDLGDGSSMEFFRTAQGNSDDHDNPEDPSVWGPYLDKYIATGNKQALQQIYNHKNTTDEVGDYIYENYPGDSSLDLGDGSSMEFFRTAQGNSDDHDNPEDPSVWRPYLNKYIATGDKGSLQQIYNHKNTTDEVGDFIYENYPGDTLLDLGDGSSMEFFRTAQGNSDDHDNPEDPSVWKPYINKYLATNNKQLLQQIYNHKNTTDEVADYIHENYPGDTLLDLGDGTSMEFFRTAQGNSDDYDNPEDPSSWRPYINKYLDANNTETLQQIYGHKNTTDEVEDYIYENYPGDALLNLDGPGSQEYRRVAQGNSDDHDNPGDPSVWKPYIDKMIATNNPELRSILNDRNTIPAVKNYIRSALSGNRSGLNFGGFRQHGGPVRPGSAYVVGEAGQELFVPDEPGQIIPYEGEYDPNATGTGYNPEGPRPAPQRASYNPQGQEENRLPNPYRGYGLTNEDYNKFRNGIDPQTGEEMYEMDDYEIGALVLKLDDEEIEHARAGVAGRVPAVNLEEARNVIGAEYDDPYRIKGWKAAQDANPNSSSSQLKKLIRDGASPKHIKMMFKETVDEAKRAGISRDDFLRGFIDTAENTKTEGVQHGVAAWANVLAKTGNVDQALGAYEKARNDGPRLTQVSYRSERKKRLRKEARDAKQAYQDLKDQHRRNPTPDNRRAAEEALARWNESRKKVGRDKVIEEFNKETTPESPVVVSVDGPSDPGTPKNQETGAPIQPARPYTDYDEGAKVKRDGYSFVITNGIPVIDNPGSKRGDVDARIIGQALINEMIGNPDLTSDQMIDIINKNGIKTNESAGKKFSYALRMIKAEKIIRELRQKGYTGADLKQYWEGIIQNPKIPFTDLDIPGVGAIGKLAARDDAKLLAQAARNWASASIRDESGAAIPEWEIKLETQKYIGDLFDDNLTLDQKRESRDDRILGLIAGTGPLAPLLQEVYNKEIKGFEPETGDEADGLFRASIGAIGGWLGTTLGSAGGAIAAPFTYGIVNPVTAGATGGVALGGLGAAIGEAVDDVIAGRKVEGVFDAAVEDALFNGIVGGKIKLGQKALSVVRKDGFGKLFDMLRKYTKRP